MKYLLTLLFSLSILVILQGQTLTISVNQDQFQVDETRQLVVSRIADISQYEDVSTFSEIVINLNGSEYTVQGEVNEITHRSAYQVLKDDINYTLYFTPLPLIAISPTDSIVDDPKRHAQFIYADDEQVLRSDMGIEIRGGFSQSYPKKTYDLEFWEDESGEESKNLQFGKLRSDDDWVLDALYNEPLRVRSLVAHKMWLDIHKPYYLAQEEGAKSGADVMHVEVFLDGEYNGLYTLSEQVDRKQLKLKKLKNGEIRGELYKGNDRGATTFSRLPQLNNSAVEWGGHEIKYPDDTISWDRLYEFTDFVMNSSDEEFKTNVWTYFDQRNHIDYFIYLNLLSASDNTGKNIYVARYNTDDPYFYSPWDLDGCLGTQWRGNNIGTTRGILTNEMHNRVLELNPDNYKEKAAQRWHELRETLFSDQDLLDEVTELYTYLKDNKIYERESLVYPNYDFGEVDFNYITNWIPGRTAYLDGYFDELTSYDTLIEGNDIKVFPNPVNDFLLVYGPRIDYNLGYGVYNASGVLIRQGRTTGSRVPMTGLAAGLYIVLLDERPFRVIKH